MYKTILILFAFVSTFSYSQKFDFFQRDSAGNYRTLYNGFKWGINGQATKSFQVTTMGALDGILIQSNTTGQNQDPNMLLINSNGDTLDITMTNAAHNEFPRSGVIFCSAPNGYHFEGNSFTWNFINSIRQNPSDFTPAFNITPTGVGIGVTTPTAGFDLNVPFRYRVGAVAGSVLVSDVNGNATWSAFGVIETGTNGTDKYYHIIVNGQNYWLPAFISKP